MHKIVCFKCHHNWEYEPPLGRADDCPKCHWDSHVCLNCKHYDRNSHHECREPDAEFVQNKERSNFCDYFEPLAIAKISQEKNAALSQLEGLFGNKNAGDQSTQEQSKKSLADELQAFLSNKKK